MDKPKSSLNRLNMTMTEKIKRTLNKAGRETIIFGLKDNILIRILHIIEKMHLFSGKVIFLLLETTLLVGAYMFKIQTLNKISPRGLDRFPHDSYEIATEFSHPDAIL